MKNRKHYIVIKNPNAIDASRFSWRKYIVIAEGETYTAGKYYTAEDTEEAAQAEADRRNSKYYISDYADDEIEAFYNTIDFAAIELAISDYLGTRITFQRMLKPTRDGWTVELESDQDLCEVIPVIGKLFASCKIDNFGGSIFVDKLTGELRCWLPLHFSYTHFDGGSNGCDLADVMVDNGGQAIVFAKDQWLRYKDEKY